MKFKRQLLACIMMLFMFSGFAVAKDIRAKGDVAFESGVFSSEPDEETKQKAVSNAVANAWKRYTSEFTTSQFNVYKQTKSYFEAHPEEFIVDKAIIEQSNDPNTNTYSVVVSVSFNDVAVDGKLNEGNNKGGSVGVPGGKSLISFLFVAREQESVKSFDARVTKKASLKAEEDKSEDTSLSDSGGKVKTSDEVVITQVTGGNTELKKDQVSYSILPSGEVDAAVSDVLSSNNFEVVSFPDITAMYHGPSMDQIKIEFSKSNELSADLRLAAIRAAKASDVSMRFFAIGTLDARVADIDPATGNKRTSVSFRGQIWDITSGLPRVVASNGPVQKFGLGLDAASATTDALKRAATEGATELVNQLNSRKIR